MAEDFDFFAEPAFDFFAEPPHKESCKNCYEVAPGVQIHQPRSGAAYIAWTERWERAAEEQEREKKLARLK